MNLIRRIWIYSLALSLLFSMTALAHVGSPGVIIQKQAGKYQVLVSVSPPEVIPGTANVTVFVEQGRVKSIEARPIYFSSGDEGAPTHDELKAVAAGRFEGVVWLMSSGSSSVELLIDGPDGKEKVIAPVMSVATATPTMPAGTGIGLLALGLFLFVLMITIVGASLSDGTLKPGQSFPAALRRKRFIGMGIGALVLALIMTGWRSWWNASAEHYRSYNLYKPLEIQSSVVNTGNQAQLAIQLDTASYGRYRRSRPKLSFVVPDHGKLMHVFLVRTPGLDAFAHLHPDRLDSLHYGSRLPQLPKGHYLLYADMVYRNGFAETLTDTVTITTPTAASMAATDPDDSWLVTEPMGVQAQAVGVPHLDDDMVLCGKPSASAKLQDGSTMLWNDKAGDVLETGKPYVLRFAVADVQGKPAQLEPYLGMGGHAAIVRSDGTVYVHLHPVGTYSMAAEESLAGRIADTTRIFHYPDANQFRDSIDTYVAYLKQLPEAEKNKALMAAMPGMDMPGGMTHAMKVNNMVEFPYAFPRAGHYRIWVQVRRNGRVLTGMFDTQVKDSLM